MLEDDNEDDNDNNSNDEVEGKDRWREGKTIAGGVGEEAKVGERRAFCGGRPRAACVAWDWDWQ